MSTGQEALLKIAQTPEAGPYKAIYDAKIAGNGHLLDFYDGKLSPEFKQGFFAHSASAWKSIRELLLEVVPKYLPESGFIGGDAPGEDDFHLAAVLARFALFGGATKTEDGVAGLEKAVGKPVPASVAKYWKAWSERDSWKKVYGEKLV